MAWLRDLAWPVDGAVFAAEACAGDGHEGIQRVFLERSRAAGDLSVIVFNCLELRGRAIMREPWRDRRKGFEDVLDGAGLPRVGVVPVTDDAARLWDTWVGLAGEGIALKDRASIYRPGVRSPAWLKAKPKLVLEVVVTGGSGERVQRLRHVRGSRPCGVAVDAAAGQGDRHRVALALDRRDVNRRVEASRSATH